jgi:hypothetical protein
LHLNAAIFVRVNAKSGCFSLRHGTFFRFHDGVAIVEANMEVGAIRYRLMMAAGHAH